MTPCHLGATQWVVGPGQAGLALVGFGRRAGLSQGKPEPRQAGTGLACQDGQAMPAGCLGAGLAGRTAPLTAKRASVTSQACFRPRTAKSVVRRRRMQFCSRQDSSKPVPDALCTRKSECGASSFVSCSGPPRFNHVGPGRSGPKKFGNRRGDEALTSSNPSMGLCCCSSPPAGEVSLHSRLSPLLHRPLRPSPTSLARNAALAPNSFFAWKGVSRSSSITVASCS